MLSASKRLMALLVLLVSIVFPGAAAARSERATFDYLALGDSLAFGFVDFRTPPYGYADWLAEHFSQPQHGNVNRLINLGVASIPGETSGSFIDRGSELSQLQRAIAAIDGPSNVRVVTLDIGGNDIVSLLRGADPPCADPLSLRCQMAVQAALAGFAQNYMIILDSITAALDRDPGNEALLIMTYYNGFSRPGDANPLVAAQLKAVAAGVLLGADGRIDCSASGAAIGLNDLIACIGAEYGATIVDVYPLFESDPVNLIGPDNVHPTLLGYQVIADAFKAAYRQNGFMP
jgi:lysophospholipase L1-like esterase